MSRDAEGHEEGAAGKASETRHCGSQVVKTASTGHVRKENLPQKAVAGCSW